MVEREAVVKSRHGLHARPSAEITKTVGKYGSTEVKIIDPSTSEECDAKSILSLLTMEKMTGTRLIVKAVGPDEEEAAIEVARIINEFDV